MLHITTLRENPVELSEFLIEVWKSDYAGKMPFPLWSAEYLDWQLRISAHPDRSSLIGAYDGNRLVATVLGTDYPFQIAGEGVVRGSIWSWLSIHPEYRGRKLTSELVSERIRRTESSGKRLNLSYRYSGSRYSLAERPRRDPLIPNKVFHGKLGFWTRVLEPHKVSRWSLSPIERFAAGLAAPLIPSPRHTPEDHSIRPIRASDIDDCLAVIRAETALTPLTIAWDGETLAHQLLETRVVRTWVAESRGRVVSFVNFHVLPFIARTTEPVGIIDILAIKGLPARQGTRLLSAALADMKSLGAILALKLRSGDVSSVAMLRNHFIPRHADSHLVLHWNGEVHRLPQSTRMHLLWR